MVYIMKSKILILITSILSIGLIGCGNINAKNIGTKDTIENTVALKPKNTSNKENNIKTVDIHKKQKKEIFINSKNNQEMSTYTNSRFGFSINYPKDFTLKKTSTNNDGAKMTLGKAAIIVYGYNNVLNDTAKSLYDEKLKNIKSQSIQEKII